ncbi:transposase [Streptomyces shenzhenensis]|uniref:transposase n=1 Tax=Streptomyces shenzhenensis TaxID=943815 RepID=UPI00380D837E
MKGAAALPEVARELELNPETLRSWVNKHRKQQEPAPDAELTAKDPRWQASTSSSTKCGSTPRSTHTASSSCAADRERRGHAPSMMSRTARTGSAAR